MDDTRNHKKIASALSGEERGKFTRLLLEELRVLEQLVSRDMFERGVSRIGAEQEIFLVDKGYHPAPAALKMLEAVKDPHFTTELGLFNLEMNAPPQMLSGGGLAAMEADLASLFRKAQAGAESLGLHALMVGILPTIGKTDLRLDNMVPNPRYLTLSRAMDAARGEAYDFSIRGADELIVRHDSVMVEACNASFQVHLQVAEPERFAHYYNLAQLLLAPVLAGATNSPLLFGRRLWAETRIALFEQACDIRNPGHHLRESMGRVSFGRDWLRGGIVDIFRENVTRHRALVGVEDCPSPALALERGEVPDFRALRLHNGTIYRWNRPCLGVSENGKPHLRIELRVLPSGPSVVDEVANAALWLGLMSELVHSMEGLESRLDFADAKNNLYAASRDGLGARFVWIDGEEVLAQKLILDRLIPMAEKGLHRAQVNPGDISKYLGVLDERIRTLRTGSQWALRSFAAMSSGQGGRRTGSKGARLTALVAATVQRQTSELPISAWADAELHEKDRAPKGDQKVSQYMNSDFVCVQPDEPIELALEVMRWEKVRHLAVEDERGKLMGLVTYAVLAKALGVGASDASALAEVRRPSEPVPAPGGRTGGRAGGPLSVQDCMQPADLVVTPDTPTLEAAQLFRSSKLNCVPVVQDGYIVALLTAENFVDIAEHVIAESSRQLPPSDDSDPRMATLEEELADGPR
jgi:CBS domain-containing protein